MIAIGFAGASFAAFGQPAVSETTTVERSSTVEVPKPDVRVDERKSTTTTVTSPPPALPSVEAMRDEVERDLNGAS